MPRLRTSGQALYGECLQKKVLERHKIKLVRAAHPPHPPHVEKGEGFEHARKCGAKDAKDVVLGQRQIDGVVTLALPSPFGVVTWRMLIRSPLYFPPSPQREGLAGSHVGLCAGCEHLDCDCQQTAELSDRTQRPTGHSRMEWRPVLPSS